MTVNIIIIAVILYVIAIFIFFLFKKDHTAEDRREDIYSLEYLGNRVKDRINIMTDTSKSDYSLSQSAAKKEEARKLQLMKALRNCGHGDINAKVYVKDYMKAILQRDLNINELTIGNVILFDEFRKLTIIDKFNILLYLYKKKYGLDAFYTMITENNFDTLKGTGTREEEYHYEITAEDIERLFDESYIILDYVDKLEIITQRIYERYLGNGVIDEIRDMKKLDGLSAGLGGLSKEYYNYLEEYLIEKRNDIGYYYNSIWIMFQGKTIHLSFLGFGSQAELIRVAKKIYRYDEPGYLSEDKGYMINSMSDGSRVVVVRPKVAENWAFFIRKLNSMEDVSIEKLITDKNSDLAIRIMKWLVGSCCTIAVTGKQFSGKTTLLKALVEFINPLFNIRVQEMIFELHLKEIERYRNRNILTLRDTQSVNGQSVMDLFKKTDGDIYIFGEVHSPDACTLVVQGALTGTRQMMFSHHAKTTEALIDSFKVALLQTNVFSHEMAAQEQVARAINFDFHMATTVDGHIYLERITEIIPERGRPYPEQLKDCFREFFSRITDEKRYRTKDILVFHNGRYEIVGRPDKKIRIKLSEYLPEKELQEYDELFQGVEEEAV